MIISPKKLEVHVHPVQPPPLSAGPVSRTKGNSKNVFFLSLEIKKNTTKINY